MPAAPLILDTPRLRGERITLDHAPDLRRWIYNDERVMATLGGRTLTDDESRAALDRAIAHWQSHGWGTWVFRARDDNRFVARGGMHQFSLGDEATDVAGLIYHVAHAEWRRGFALEIAAATLHIAFETLGFDSVMSWTMPTNTGSLRVMEKLGMGYVRDATFANLPHQFFRITSTTWQPQRA